MANTKQLSREERKKARRKARQELKTLNRELTKAQRKKWQKSGQGIRAFLAEAKAEN